MLRSIDTILQKIMPFITPASVIIGILLSEWFSPFVYLVPWIFAFMTFAGSLGSNFSELKNIRKFVVPILITLVVLHIVMPGVAFGAGHLFFSGDSYTITGLVLAYIIPTGVTSLIWVSIYKGHLVFTILIILIDTMLAPFLVPSVMQLLVGSSIELDGVSMMVGLIWMIVLPAIAAMLLNQYTKGKINKVLGPKLSPFNKLGLSAVVIINAAAIAPYFEKFDLSLLFMVVVVFMITILGYIIGFLVSRLLKMNREMTFSLTYNSGMRNISAGAAIAITFFPPPVAVPVIICMLFQQIVASLTGDFLSRYYKRAEDKQVQVEA